MGVLDNAPRDLDRERDVNATIKLILSEVELAARQMPVDACEPYACDERRKRIIRTVWSLYRRCMAPEETDDDTRALQRNEHSELRGGAVGR